MDKMEQITHAIRMFIKTPQVTTFYTIVSAFFGYLFSVEKPEILFIIFLLIVIDFITGITASKIKGNRLTSNKGFGTIVKIVFYMGAIALVNLVARTCELYDFGTDVAITASKGVIFFIVGLEVKSIFENFELMGYKMDHIKEILLNLFKQKK